MPSQRETPVEISDTFSETTVETQLQDQVGTKVAKKDKNTWDILYTVDDVPPFGVMFSVAIQVGT